METFDPDDYEYYEKVYKHAYLLTYDYEYYETFYIHTDDYEYYEKVHAYLLTFLLMTMNIMEEFTYILTYIHSSLHTCLLTCHIWICMYIYIHTWNTYTFIRGGMWHGIYVYIQKWRHIHLFMPPFAITTGLASKVDMF
jgi:hypothetical protein